MKNSVRLLILGILLLASSGVIWVSKSKNLGPGTLVPKNKLVVWESPSSVQSRPTSLVETKFEVVNIGNSPVQILSVESGCGCTTPRVDPKIIAPGKSGFVSVEAIPFPVGEKTVPITLRTDSPTTPSVLLAFRMIGRQRPPFLLMFVGDLDFSNINSSAEPRDISILTVELEPIAKVPKPLTNVTSLQFEFRSVTEKPYTSPGTILRTYTYRVRLDPDSLKKTIAGEVWVVDPWAPGHVESLRFFVKVDSAVRTVPSPVVLRLEGMDQQERHSEFLIITKSPAPDLLIEPASSSGDAPRVERLSPDSDNRISRFKISARAGLKSIAKEYQFVVRLSPSTPVVHVFTVVVKEDGQ